MKFTVSLLVILYSLATHAELDFTSPEYERVNHILDMPASKIQLEEAKHIMSYTLSESLSSWEEKIFDSLKEKLKNPQIKLSPLKHLLQHFLYLSLNDAVVYNYLGHTYEISQKTKILALDSFWDLARTHLTTNQILSSIEAQMFRVTQMSTSTKPEDLKIAHVFLKKAGEYLQKGPRYAEVETFALYIKNNLFNIYTLTESNEVRSEAYKIIQEFSLHRNKYVGQEYLKSIAEIGLIRPQISCRGLWI